MSPDEAALIRLWKEKRGEAEPEDLSDNLIVQLGRRHRGAQQDLVRAKHRTDGHRRPALGPASGATAFIAATLDGLINETDAVFEAKFMLPWSFSEEAAAEKHMAQLQHNMWVTNSQIRRRSRSSPAAANGSR